MHMATRIRILGWGSQVSLGEHSSFLSVVEAAITTHDAIGATETRNSGTKDEILVTAHDLVTFDHVDKALTAS